MVTDTRKYKRKETATTTSASLAVWKHQKHQHTHPDDPHYPLMGAALTFWVLVHVLEFVAEHVQDLAPMMLVSHQWKRALTRVKCISAVDHRTSATDVRTICSTFPHLTGIDVEGWTDHPTMVDLVRSLTTLPNMKRLRMVMCPYLVDDHLQTLSGLTKLTSLDLSLCAQIKCLSPLQTLTTLQDLTLSNCYKLSNVGLRSSLCKLTNLQCLDLSNCSGIDDDVLRSLSPLVNLQSLDLSDCESISDTGIASLTRLPNLQYLGLSGCVNLTNNGLSVFSTLTQLHIW